ncbi:hypothetical protein NSQ20_15690 [Paenibacillus sp. FSL K6-1122]|nr:hypothetical protein [Paenibacillus amylolyticus]WFA87165.1 hypothetical protein OGI70_09745 [Paenibacillus amylolyticus]
MDINATLEDQLVWLEEAELVWQIACKYTWTLQCFMRKNKKRPDYQQAMP